MSVASAYIMTRLLPQVAAAAEAELGLGLGPEAWQCAFASAISRCFHMWLATAPVARLKPDNVTKARRGVEASTGQWCVTLLTVLKCAC